MTCQLGITSSTIAHPRCSAFAPELAVRKAKLAHCTTYAFSGCHIAVPSRASVLSSGTLGVAMEASLAHKKAIAMSFPLNGWGSWTEEDIWTAVQVSRACVDTGRVFDVLL